MGNTEKTSVAASNKATAYYAVMADGSILAEGGTYSVCSRKALAAGEWDMQPGTVAPCVIQSWKPEEKA